MDMTPTTTNDTAYTGAVCMSITAAHDESQNTISYYHQYDYGHYTTWYYLAILGVGIAFYSYRLFRNRKPPPRPDSGRTSTSLGHKIVALGRLISYRSVGGATAARWGMPRLGMLLFLLFTFLFFLLMTFLIHPYYCVRRGYGSPPLAVRAGLMATAMTPIIVALSGKVNVVTLLTGISHEKLNIFHRWTSYLCLFMSVVHTVPFIVTPLQTCGPDGLRAQFYKPGGYERYTGVPPLGMLVGLTTLSVPFIRHHFYNFFYRLHIPMYVTYLGLMFWHAGNEQDSWAYLWATLAIWLFSVLTRLFTKWQTFHVRRSWFQGFPASMHELPGNMTRLTVLALSDLQWKPSQHCWIRIPHLSILQNHPFTIANLAKKQDGSSLDMQDMVFYVRAHRGLTLKLHESIEQHKDKPLPVHIDGPYGGLIENVPALYESLVFVAGGSGISACLPWIRSSAQRIREGRAMVTNIRLVWMVRQPVHTQWVLDELREVASAVGTQSCQLDFYITDTSLQQGSTSGVSADVEKMAGDKETGFEQEGGGKTADLPDVGTVQNHRPYLPDLLPSFLTQRRIFIFGCGPESLRLDLGNAVSKAQEKVLRGKADSIELHTEMFGW